MQLEAINEEGWADETPNRMPQREIISLRVAGFMAIKPRWHTILLNDIDFHAS